PPRLYERVYCMRGEIENRIKELFDVALDRTSCSRFRANQLRVLLAAAAFVLLQELRLAARGTAWARAQVNTLRLELLKIGVRIVASVRRLVLRMPDRERRPHPRLSLRAWPKTSFEVGIASFRAADAICLRYSCVGTGLRDQAQGPVTPSRGRRRRLHE